MIDFEQSIYRFWGLLNSCLATDEVVIGTVGRMHGIKDQLTLIKAFIYACEQQPTFKSRLKLIIVGDGPLREKAINLLEENQLMDNA